MAKEVMEVSIESIKKEITDKLKDNLNVLQYLNDGICGTIDSQIVSRGVNYIYDYGIELEGNYISVEVEEHEFTSCSQNDYKRYKVAIKMGLDKGKYLDNFAALVKEIIVKLFPNRKNYSNVPIYRKTMYRNTVTHILNRMITFEIEAKAHIKE